MKRIAVALSVLVTGFLLCACGSRDDVVNYIPENQTPTDFSSVVTVVSTPTSGETPIPQASSETGQGQAPIVFPSAAPSSAPAASPEATPEVIKVTPSARPSPTPNTNVTITKSPTGETVDEGGSAVFIAYANNATSTVWILVSPDTKTSFNADKGPQHFDGLGVQGQGTSKLTLSNIPFAMDGWRVQCYFTGNGGPEYTSGAYLTVIPGYVPVTAEEKIAYDLAKQCQIDVYKEASGYNYGAGSAIQNYSYYGKFGDFNLTCSNGKYVIVTEFRSYPDPAINKCVPISSVVYDSKMNQVTTRAYPDTGTAMSEFYSVIRFYFT